MRYSVKYKCAEKNWIVTDSANDDKVMIELSSKTEAYRYAYAEQVRWRKSDPSTQQLSRMRKIIPQSLVVR